ncbi:uncharacterized protein LOC123470644 [Daphnia magna]|uniref:uncharacterized protein LOC123470644 n=1 Tax=Daphnia magna TaxID=35525 RepID=UPI001E1BBA2C|nr:uncharacterized protein LOC123470644 [Daphnia magna]
MQFPVLQDVGDPLPQPDGLILEDGINWEEELAKIIYPPNWQYKKDSEEGVLNIFKLTKCSGAMCLQKNIVFNNGSIRYEVHGARVPDHLGYLSAEVFSIDMLKNAVKTFDEADLCVGVTISLKDNNAHQQLKLMECTEGFWDGKVLRSYNCDRLLKPCSSKFHTSLKAVACKECRKLKNALNKKIWNLNQTCMKRTLEKFRTARAKAVRTSARKSTILKRVKYELTELRTKLSVTSEDLFHEYINTLPPQVPS